MMIDARLAIVILIAAVIILFDALIRERRMTRLLEQHESALMRDPYECNPYAYLLGREIEAKVYEASRWERMVVVAVSWRGAVCVRPTYDLEARGRWISKDLAPERVREVRE